MTKKIKYSIVLKMTLLYLIAGLLWIRFSDVLLYKLISDPVWLTQMQTYKGWFFICSTSGLLYFILKKVYLQLSASQFEYESLFSTIRDGLVFVGVDGTILYGNDAFYSMFVADAQSVIGVDYKTIMKVSWNEGEEEFLMKQIITRGYTDIYTKDATLMNNTVVPFEVQTYRIQHKNQLMLCSVIRDVSSSRKIHNELIEAKNEAIESDRLKTAFLQNMSHEIRTPMNGIVGFSEMLKNPDLTHEKRLLYTDTIVRSSNQLLTIVTDVLDISQIETGQSAIKEDICDLNAIIDSLRDEYDSMAIEQNIQLMVSKTKCGEEALILADENKIRQVFRNLLINALKFTGQGEVRFGYKMTASDVLFFVSDTGPGIPANLYDKIFERFRKGEVNLLKEFGGTGLGLAICKGNVELMKGKIWVDSEVGVGSHFYFSIPYKSTTPKSKSDFNLKGLKVLVVEDEDVNFRYIQEVFKNHDVYIDRAENGQIAVEKVYSGCRYDIIFMDIRMPVMDGYEATREIKNIDPVVPIIAQTAFVMGENRFDAIQAGCIDYVGKPIKQSELLQMVEKHVRMNSNNTLNG